MLKSIVATLSVLVATSAFASETVVNVCSDDAGRAQVTLTSQVAANAHGANHVSTLVLDGKKLDLITGSCLWTPGIKSVLRCPHLISAQNHAEVYPKFKKGSGLELKKVSIILNLIENNMIASAETLELKNCNIQK